MQNAHDSGTCLKHPTLPSSDQAHESHEKCALQSLNGSLAPLLNLKKPQEAHVENELIAFNSSGLQAVGPATAGETQFHTSSWSVS